jgi:hypothetical protein
MATRRRKTWELVYVYRLGDSGIYKFGKIKDLGKRQGAYETISTEPA